MASHKTFPYVMVAPAVLIELQGLNLLTNVVVLCFMYDFICGATKKEAPL